MKIFLDEIHFFHMVSHVWKYKIIYVAAFYRPSVFGQRRIGVLGSNPTCVSNWSLYNKNRLKGDAFIQLLFDFEVVTAYLHNSWMYMVC